MDAFKERKNILDRIKLNKVTPILAVEDNKNRDDFIWVLLNAKMVDYTINEENLKVIDGDPLNAHSFEEFWRFVRKDDKWLADKILQVNDIDSLDYFDSLK